MQHRQGSHSAASMVFDTDDCRPARLDQFAPASTLSRKLAKTGARWNSQSNMRTDRYGCIFGTWWAMPWLAGAMFVICALQVVILLRATARGEFDVQAVKENVVRIIANQQQHTAEAGLHETGASPKKVMYDDFVEF
eukprot:2615762-Pleurochrysis_carterae.AAC.2